MNHVKSINEFLGNYRLPISKEELGVGIRVNDKLTIDHQDYYFQSFDKDTNEIYVVDENGTEEVFDLDELNDSWELSSINDHEVVVESNSFEVSIVDHIIKGLESGELTIIDFHDSDDGFFITDSEGNDKEAYSISHYADDDPNDSWYITGHTEEDEIEEDISEEDVERIAEYQ